MPAKLSPSIKNFTQVVDTEAYRTGHLCLVAYDGSAGKFLFRALNSNYFLQDDGSESIEVLEMEEAERLYDAMPSKHVTDIVAAFPMHHGGIGLDTDTNLYDD